MKVKRLKLDLTSSLFPDAEPINLEPGFCPEDVIYPEDDGKLKYRTPKPEKKVEFNTSVLEMMSLIHEIRKIPTIKPRPPEPYLWVDKYQPKRYVDLVCDESIARDVLKWVKEWDRCVFKKKVESELDKSGRPFKKILILSGPPGLGKTSLVHIIAQTAGYITDEINASDDRCLKMISNKLKSLSMNKLGHNLQVIKAPTLLIIDEIDGVLDQNGFIQCLVDFSSKSKRPIIAICNDLYVSSLRSLRNVAKVVQMKKPRSFVTLAKRLNEVCLLQNQQIEQRALYYLAETSQGDIRQCLNTLQFLQIDGIIQKEHLTNSKDVNKPIFTIWESLFCRNLNLNEAARMIKAHGDVDKIASGCHELYLKTKFPDFKRTTKIMDSLIYLDTCPAEYTPYFVAEFNIFNGSQLEYPKQDYLNYLSQKETKANLKQIEALIPISNKPYWNQETLRLLHVILSTNVKNLSKKKVEMVQEIMQFFNFQFVQKDGKFKLEPVIPSLIKRADPSISLRKQAVVSSNPLPVDNRMFKYNEGFSNAVRKVVLMKDLRKPFV